MNIVLWYVERFTLTLLVGWSVVWISFTIFKRGIWWAKISLHWLLMVLCALLLLFVYCVHYIALSLAACFLFVSNLTSVPSSSGEHRLRGLYDKSLTG